MQFNYITNTSNYLLYNFYMEKEKEKTNISISIILTSYNYEKFINESIQSIINQTYQHWELIIIDDGSKDNSVEIIKKYCEKDNRIKLYQHEGTANKGLKNSILLGLDKASYEWISFLESDDLYKLNYLETKIETIKKHPEGELIFNNVELIGDQEEINGYNLYCKKKDKILKNIAIKYRDLFDINIIPSFSCVMIKKSVIFNCNFNSPQPQSLDYFLWSQLYKKTKIIYLTEKLTYWRKHANNYTKKADFSNSALFSLDLLKNLINKDNSFLLTIYKLLSQKKIEKLFRPQVNFIKNILLKFLLKNKIYNLIIIPHQILN